ncbi:hypothetical protein Hoch_3754 [Haliangium ochraceum DSM 14365]|uniref:AMIN domain-containing protein n=2 Tax=Haliangium ochraceum TaxID=80816 RepID=D0LYA4_HALO1|nr:hypothetical protein Hoch_3754 [Haliangium ochraceum DSM 14365]
MALPGASRERRGCDRSANTLLDAARGLRAKRAPRVRVALLAALSLSLGAGAATLAHPSAAYAQSAPEGIEEIDDLDTPVQLQAGTKSGSARADDDYGGVEPGETMSRKPRRRNQLTWLGFQQRQGGAALLFVQLSSDVSYSQEVRDGTLTVKLEGARFANRNVSRRLDTRFFDTSLAQVLSKRVGKRRARRDTPARTAGIELSVTFKDPSAAREAQIEARQAEDGYHYLYLEFDPPGVRLSASQ